MVEWLKRFIAWLTGESRLRMRGELGARVVRGRTLMDRLRGH